MIPLVRPYLPRLLLAGLLAALTELAGLGLMGTATYLLVRAAEQPPLSALTVAIVAVRALAIGRGALRYTERLAGHDATLRLLTEIRTRVYASLVSRGVNLRSGDLLSRLVSDVDAVQDVLLRCLVPAFAALIVALAAIGGAFAVAPGAGLAVAAGLLVAGVGLPALAVVLARRTADRVAPLRGALAAGAVDLMHGAADLAAYGATGAALARAGQEATELARLERRLSVAAWAVDGAGVLVGGLTAAAVLATGPGGVATTVLAVCALVAVESALALVVSARRWVEVRGSVRRVVPLVDVGLSTPISGDQNGVDRPTSTSGPVGLVLDRVTVHGRALSVVDFALPAGHRVAVVGPSGAGKSTLLAVLAGHVDPDEGRVAAAGRDLAAWRPPDVRRAISGLLAEAHVFHATVRENVALGRPDATDAEFDAAARAAGLGDWIAAQPDGWDTVVGEDGAQLSGGQRQRLALARAMLAAPAVLLLDEPTEGLDPRAADRVLADVLAHAGAASVVVVTHRLTGLDALDEIVVLDGGRVIARGSHTALVERPGWYRERWLAERSHLGV